MSRVQVLEPRLNPFPGNPNHEPFGCSSLYTVKFYQPTVTTSVPRWTRFIHPRKWKIQTRHKNVIEKNHLGNNAMFSFVEILSTNTFPWKTTIFPFFVCCKKVRPNKNAKMFPSSFFGVPKISTCHTNDFNKQNPSPPKPWQLSQCEASDLPREPQKILGIGVISLGDEKLPSYLWMIS